MGRGASAIVATKPAASPPGTIKAAAAAAAAAPTLLAPGFRFHPTDEELVCYYLKRRILNQPVRFSAIADVDIYKNEPWELAGYSRLKSRDQEWYFFSALDKKYGNGARMNRATGVGYWKATGKDREIRRASVLVGMKKTLVFHSGRAPDGLRTNWVMHEYRILEDILDRNVVMQDAYVLCRVFHKNNIGPPSGNRYAPFIEEEWDDDTLALVPGANARENPVAGFNAIGRNDVEQEIQSANKELLDINELPRDCPDDYEPPRDSQTVLALCKRERSDNCPPLCVLNKEAPLPLLQYKRRRHHEPDNRHSNGSDNSTRTTQDHCSSTTTTATTTTSSATTTAISALLEFAQMESIEFKERVKHPVTPSTHNAATGFDSSVPPRCTFIINDLQNELEQISLEKDSLHLEMMSAQAMIDILKSRIESLSKENEGLKRNKSR